MLEHDLAAHARPVPPLGRTQQREADALRLGVLNRRFGESHRGDDERLVGADVFHGAPEVADDRQADDFVVVLGLDQDALVLVADDGVDLVANAGRAAQSQVVHGGSPGEHTERDRGETLVLGPGLSFCSAMSRS